MAIPAVITAGATIISGAQQLAGVFGGGKDVERLAANQDAFSKASAGNADALSFLKQRSGRFGVAYVNGYGEIGGWATQTAKDDAYSKYQTVLSVLAAHDSAGGIIQQVGDTAQSIAQQTGHTIVPGTKQDLTVVLALAAVVIFAVARRGRR